ncbi:EAL domain-containing protein [Methylobacterium sp. E-065]|uniref:putative bifunctional diguanylate cyclase/phosphodiesterase n=1 Tax=Methylobacterium sp. E-065 TaxID=2836583 RepID=UPI001FBB2E88|nr:EAL domain-containing protein [Methylobacterium sp. E-065]MCJ2019037.1 EAL domain-containing protein [Methylobacterium sp. E-065]
MRLRMILDHIDQGLVMTDADDRVRVYNRHVAGMMGVPEDMLSDGARFADVRAHQAAHGAYFHLPEHLERWLEHGDPQTRADDYERTRADGTVLHVRSLPLPGGGLVRTFTDVTQRYAAEAAVRESERRFRLLAENSNDVFVLGDLDMRRLYVSPAVRSMLGYEPEEFVGSTPFDFAHPDDAYIFADLWAKARNERDGRFIACIRYRHKAGHYLWIEASVSLARETDSDQVIGYVATLRDVTTRREAEERVRHMALHDALTGLPNRTLFRDRLDQAIAHAARSGNPFAVLACDLDRFKAVNDSFGHATGDALLRVVADRMQGVIRPYDTVARLGGDEFAIVLTYLDEPCWAIRIAEQLIAVVSEPIDLDGQMVEVGVSIGLTLTTEQNATADELFKRADIALYEAKAAGRNTYREFEIDAGVRIAMRGQLGLDMKEAIRRGEFQLAYQPVVDAATGAVVSFEALMRWYHPTQGEIPPGTFIPLAEETGLIVPLGVWALQEACREAIHWPAHIHVAVNVSAVQLRREGLEASVLSALASSGLPATRLKLEVTESVLMQDSDTVLACLHRLRTLGVLIALDDFGTGYSSLGYLRRFPFDKIKIDQAFVRDIADPDAAAIVRAVVGIGERLGMGIVAEGIETVEQLDLVRREGCTLVQGFLFSPPLPSHEARRYMEAAQGRAA